MLAMVDKTGKRVGSISRRDFLGYSTAALGVAGLGMAFGSKKAYAAQSDETYVWLCAVTAIAFWIDGRMGLEGAGKALGVKTKFLGPVEYDAAQQVRIMDELIVTKPAGIMVFPADQHALIDPMKRAMDSGIPVVCVNSDVADHSARYGFIGPDNRGVGRTGGEIAAKLLDGKGRVAIMTVPGIEVHESRTAGYKDAFAKYPGIKIVDVVDDKSDPSYGVTVATGLVQAHPDLDMIIGTDATAGSAIARALKETGKAGKIKVVAMDRDDDMLPYVKDGTISATLAQKSTLEEWTATHYLYWLNHNSVPAFKDWRVVDAPQIPAYTDVGVTIVTKENVDYYFHK
jgi:ribose transport system substrate-binding protein